MPSALWRCWLGGRKGSWPVKNWVVGCWRGYLSGSRCRFAYGPVDATATHYFLLQKIRIGFTFLVLPLCCRLTGQSQTKSKRPVKRVCVLKYRDKWQVIANESELWKALTDQLVFNGRTEYHAHSLILILKVISIATVASLQYLINAVIHAKKWPTEPYHQQYIHKATS